MFATVADASVLIHLARIGSFQLLKELYNPVGIAPRAQVNNEKTPVTGRAGFIDSKKVYFEALN